jgi:RluA family pseudouridine synthase
MELLSTHVISKQVEDIRFLDYVIANIETVNSRNAAKKAIKSGLVTLDGEKVESGRFVKSGQIIKHFKVDEITHKVFECEIPVIYEDEFFAIINKPAGLSVSGNYFRTVQNALTFNLKPSTEKDSLLIPRPVHRIDNQTRGLLLIAKTEKASIYLGKLFEEKKITKYYRAIVIGLCKAKGTISYPIEGKESISEYERISTVSSRKYGSLSLVKLKPLTGRTHQLRIHLSQIGHPILGDKIYGEADLLLKGKGLFLMAFEMQFQHPFLNKPMSITLDLPHKFSVFMRREHDRFLASGK